MAEQRDIEYFRKKIFQVSKMSDDEIIILLTEWEDFAAANSEKAEQFLHENWGVFETLYMSALYAGVD